MTGSSNQGIKTVLHPVSDVDAAKAVYTALLGAPPQHDAPYYVGYDLADQHIGLVPNGGSQGMAGPVAYWHVTDIEAKLAEVTAAGATVKIVAPKVGGAKLSDGKKLAADGQLAGTPSIVFDAVAVLLSSEGGEQLEKEAAAVDFVRDAFGHLKALALDEGGLALFDAAGLEADKGVVSAEDPAAFVEAAKGRFFDREAKVRILP